MPAVDTNILVRFITRDNEQQAQRSKALMMAGAWIAKTVILETEWVLRSSYRYSPQATHDALTELLGLPGVEVEDSTEIAQALDWFAAGIDFADALHLASRPAGVTFATFDETLVRRARRADIPDMSQV